ncbi:hypothetical protein NQ314_018749 [Rhamnusium bicolor]|uniref:C2H2-type domain-containing protein n=1 Tax=Rhamnusium bicolor TaxID=1586634 RepID=A0AAV8WR78_9CUCU|nr:hypothetical protein NQ314_018749 [Rhamnusium bicolor]
MSRWKIHGVNLNIYCDICDKYFETASKLRQHIKYHGEKKFECDTCGEKFLYNYLAEKHKRRVHLNELPIKCDLCDKRFANNYHLQQHEKVVHLGVRHPCYTCNKVFTTVKYLKEHVKKDS